MKINLKKLLFAASLFFALLFSTTIDAQSSSSTDTKLDKSACTSKEKSSCASTEQATSGCTPSACSGAKTKFGEAKVISNLRLSLLALKADMEKSTQPKFDERSYDIHGIIGESDDESLAIIAKEVKLIENAFAKSLNHKPLKFKLPEHKAKQVQYLSLRIEELKQLL